MGDLQQIYEDLNILSKQDLKSKKISEDIAHLTLESIKILSLCNKKTLKSKILNKDYFVYDNAGKFSRPINSNLFLEEIPNNLIKDYVSFDWNNVNPDQLPKLLYTLAMAYCASVDILGTQDKKRPSIFFEIFIGNLFAREFGINPEKNIRVDNEDIHTTLPTDFLFKPQNQNIRVHLPVKLSTRERSIQAWAHQKILEGIFGKGRFRGIMVVMGETNFVSKDNSVVEVCLPDQWRLYQMYIAEMTRIYYLDVPLKYGELPNKFPHIQVKHLSAFFYEKNMIVVKSD